MFDLVRLVLVHGIVSLVNIYVDYPSLSGAEGLIPHEPLLSGIRIGYERTAIIKYFPSLMYWVSPNTLIYSGMFIGIVGIVAPKNHWIARIACGYMYLVLLSFSLCQGLVMWFPWDCMLFELLVLCALCPNNAFVFLFLLFRVMFGFGKHKFIGADSWDDLTYTASMACWQPLGTSLGWFLTWLPDWVHVGAIIFTFFAEIVCPFLLFTKRRMLACYSAIGLMAMIQLTGNFGWFNTLTASLAWAVSCSPSSDPKPFGSPYRSWLSKVLMGLYISVCAVFLIPSQWNSPSVFYQHSFQGPEFDIFRIASSWRLVHTYGVFPPKKMPMIKPVGEFEVLHTGDTSWTPLEFHYQDSLASGNRLFHPMSVAPLRFPRFDYIYGFYSASHVFSLGTRLGGPSFGDGREYINSVARTIMDGNSHTLDHLFKTPALRWTGIEQVRFNVVGLVPDWEKGWNKFSSELDQSWSKEDIVEERTDIQVSDSLGPQMIALRQRSSIFLSMRTQIGNLTDVTDIVSTIESTFNHSLGHRFFDAAVVLAGRETKGRFISQREWLNRVKNHYELFRNRSTHSIPQMISSDCESGINISSLYDLCHSMTFGGYMGCLTSAHLLPPVVHNPLCPEILIANAQHRHVPGDPFSKIPITDFVYWMLGISLPS